MVLRGAGVGEVGEVEVRGGERRGRVVVEEGKPRVLGV